MRSLHEVDRSYEGLFDIDDTGGDEGGGEQDVSRFMQDFGWHFNASQVAELERITLDAAWELPYIQFLNDLAYLKAYTSHMKQLNHVK